MPKLWAGRTAGVTDSVADDFNSSICFDCKMFREDITGSMAHAAMLGAKGIITKQESEQLIDGLQAILEDLDSGALEFDFGCEDIHMFVEQVLTARLGDVGRKLHTARSRNDQVALDLRMYLRSQIDEITALVKDVLTALVDQVQANKTVIMPGYTHLQRASTAFIAFRKSPPQAAAMYSKAPSSGTAFRAVRSSMNPTARFTACKAAAAEICLNSNTVERLKMALNT